MWEGKFACGGVLLDSGIGPNGEGDRRYQLQYLDALFAAIRGIFMSSHVSNVRSQPDRVLVEIADYVMNYKVASDLAYETARNCLIDTLGCGLEALEYSGLITQIRKAGGSCRRL
jgi:hypothetical protein